MNGRQHTFQLSWKHVPPKHPTNGMTWIKLFKNQVNSNMQGAKESTYNTVLKFPNSIQPHRMACLLCKSKLRSFADGRTSPGWFVIDLLNYVWTKLCFKLPKKTNHIPNWRNFFNCVMTCWHQRHGSHQHAVLPTWRRSSVAGGPQVSLEESIQWRSSWDG